MEQFINTILIAIVFIISTFVHEMGHAVFALIYTRGNVVINIGLYDKLFDISIGRIRLIINKIFFVGGNTIYEIPRKIRDHAAIILGGPLFSFVTWITALLVLSIIKQQQINQIERLLLIIFIIGLLHFISSIIPVEYSDVGFEKVSTDGMQLKRLLSGRK